MAERDPFKGVYPMLYAFFGPESALDREAMRRQVEYCIAAARTASRRSGSAPR